MTDLTDLALILGKANKDNRMLIEALIKLIGEQKSPEVNVSMDVEKIIRSMPKPIEPKAPVVNFEMPEKPKEKTPQSYKFTITRDGHGRASEIIATPVGEVR